MTTGSTRGPARETGEGTTGLGCGTLAESVSNDMLSSGTDAPADWLRITEAWRKLVDDSANAEYRPDLPLDAEEDLLAAVLVRRLGGGVGVLDTAVLFSSSSRNNNRDEPADDREADLEGPAMGSSSSMGSSLALCLPEVEARVGSVLLLTIASVLEVETREDWPMPSLVALRCSATPAEAVGMPFGRVSTWVVMRAFHLEVCHICSVTFSIPWSNSCRAA